MENGFDRKLADKLSSLELNDPSNISDSDSLFQVMKAVEAAEATIKQQVEENDRLRTELQHKIQELEKHKSYEQTRRWGKNVDETYGVDESTTSVGNPEDSINIKSLQRSSLVDQRVSPFPHNDSVLDGRGNAREISTERHSESSSVNGTMKLISSGQIPADIPVLTQFSSPSTSSISLSRYQTEAEYDPKFNSSGHGLIPIAEANNSNRFPKQVREHEQEIAHLRRYLAEFTVREAQIRNEKSVLEKRIAYMRLAFDQQQQDLVDASSKALSYRQDIMEENIRLSYQLQAAQQDRLTFVSSLLPLLAEYSLQPPVPDAHSIVSNVKVLFKHLQEQLYITESKLKDSQFQLAPWPPVEATPSHFAIQSPGHLVGGAAMNKDGHELVAKPNFIPSKPPPSSDAQMPVRMDGFTEHQDGLGGLLQRNMEHDEVGRYSPLASRHPIPRSGHREYGNARGDAQKLRPSEEPPKQVKFRDPVSSMDDPDAEVPQNEPESSATWTPGNDDPNFSYSPNLQPVLEEPSSSFSEAGPDDDPLPAVDGLQISGDAVPGRELQASGYSINGTTSCNFEWVRHIADGSVKYIEGAKQPSYLVTADDVDNYLAIEVQPLDNRKRKGELVKVFANDNRKISLEPGMQTCLEAAHYSGSASFTVELSTRYLDIWEPAILTIKREGYNIKSDTPNGITITEKFSRDTMVTIPYGHSTTFSISDSNYEEHILRSESGPEDVSNCRDTIVLILRLFIMRAGQKPTKGKRKGLFFKK